MYDFIDLPAVHSSKAMTLEESVMFLMSIGLPCQDLA